MVSIEYGIKGPCFGVVSACSTATHSIGLVYRMIKEGLIDLGIGGAAEASLAWGATRAWQAMRVLSPDGLWPFSKNRNGTVLAEGGGVLLLEEMEHAKERGAPILAEIIGYGMTADAADMVNPSIDGASTAMQMALDDARISAGDIDYVNAHGTATAVNDINETRAIKRVFGKAANDVSISSTKSMHGHCLGGGGSIEATAAIMAMKDNFVPPTIGLTDPDPECDLDYTPNAGKERDVAYAMFELLCLWRPERGSGFRPRSHLISGVHELLRRCSDVAALVERGILQDDLVLQHHRPDRGHDCSIRPGHRRPWAIAPSRSM